MMTKRIILYACIGIFVVLTVLVFSGGWRDTVWCPVDSFGTRHISADVYLKLDESNQPEFLEVRRTNYNENKWVRRTTVLFRAYGTERIGIRNDFGGLQFELYSDSLKESPDTTFVVAVERKTPYFEIRLGDRTK